MKFPTLAAIALLGCTLAAPAFAQNGPPPGGPPSPEQRAARFDAADKNKDGKLTKDEFVSSLPEQAKDRADGMWSRMDAAGKGSVTKDEFLAARPGQRPPG
jgi:hypothetical protein